MNYKSEKDHTNTMGTHKVIIALLCVVILPLFAVTQRLSRDLQVDILINQAGYMPSSSKVCLVKGSRESNFEVVEVNSGKVVFTGKLATSQGDFGFYSAGDFSQVKKEGKYYLVADTLRSYPFTIHKEVYQHPINSIIQYFSKQRCGASTTGYLTPCHTDDGIRVDNGKHKNVSGGWHDASDLRKWVSATIYGVIGLARAYELQPPQVQKTILDELKWGNQYFLKMQEPDGYVMDFVGGDLEKHSDNNRWTDNKVSDGGTGIKLITPNAGKSKAPMLTSGMNDDRIIQTQPVEGTAQHNFITAQALLARITAKIDKNYSNTCLVAAKKCYNWCLQSAADTTAEHRSAALQAAIEMFRATNEQHYIQRAVSLAGDLIKMQSVSPGLSGFYYQSPNSDQPHKNIWVGCGAFIGTADLIEILPKHSDAIAWKAMLKSYAENYLLTLSRNNQFGIVPFGLYVDKDPGGKRQTGKYWYRYFMEPNPDWWVGINSNLASSGVGLLKAGKLLNDPKLVASAQRQLDWILGFNPYNSSTLVGTGYNHPEHFPGSTFYPRVPVINGAVMNGLGGDKDDQPYIGSGDWQVSEYWTPMVAYTLWLMSATTDLKH